jgi:hypothetical protein
LIDGLLPTRTSKLARAFTRQNLEEIWFIKSDRIMKHRQQVSTTTSPTSPTANVGGHQSIRHVSKKLPAIIPPDDNALEPMPMPLPGADAMEMEKNKKHNKTKNENSIDTKHPHHTKKKKDDAKHHKSAQPQLAKDDVAQPSVFETQALQEDEVIDAKPPSSRKSKKKKKKDNDHDGNKDNNQATETSTFSSPNGVSDDASMSTFVAHLAGEDEIDPEIIERIKQQVLREESERIRQEVEADYQQHYLQQGPHEAEQVNTEQRTFCNKPVSRRRQLLIYSLIFVIVVAIIAITLVFTLQEPEPKSSLSLVCQETCNGLLTGTPVTVDGEEFQKAISEYLKNPSSSPYGTVINCWDVSQVSFYPHISLGVALLFISSNVVAISKCVIVCR